MAAELRPVPEFAAFAAHVPDIIRPKPRRLSDVRQNQGTAVILVGSDRLVLPTTQLRAPGDGAAPPSTSSTSGSSQHFPELNCADLENDVFRDDGSGIAECTPLRATRPLQRNLAGGSAPALHRPRPRSTSRPRPHTPHAGVGPTEADSGRCPAEGQVGRAEPNPLVDGPLASERKFSRLDVVDGCATAGKLEGSGIVPGVYGGGVNVEGSPCEDLEVYDIDATGVLVSAERR